MTVAVFTSWQGWSSLSWSVTGAGEAVDRAVTDRGGPDSDLSEVSSRSRHGRLPVHLRFGPLTVRTSLAGAVCRRGWSARVGGPDVRVVRSGEVVCRDRTG
ncbi:hypothetical protein GCM10012279_02650 [Micromonospora yangpuensis]|uniref:Uncharacterized protein n=1 Tax=Micromonospora yangpuensis TaxID=683228 RepID=A0A1C6U992_9ACTN|nr:hypothetical protein GCM10012279_02650 [Micromonospora yangpuensis]SCL50660.1 hypothetical protein GA0070617_1552 [Micromonospora yangpuensis]